jgi:hypothetical protein
MNGAYVAIFIGSMVAVILSLLAASATKKKQGGPE